MEITENSRRDCSRYVSISMLCAVPSCKIQNLMQFALVTRGENPTMHHAICILAHTLCLHLTHLATILCVCVLSCAYIEVVKSSADDKPQIDSTQFALLALLY